MQNHHQKQTRNMEEEAMDRLCASVMEKVQAIEVFRLKVRSAVSGVLAIVAFAALAAALVYLIREANKSGLFGFTSLFATDTGYMVGNLGGTILPITDTIPVTLAIVAIALLVLLMGSARRFVTYREALGRELKQIETHSFQS